MKTNHQKIQVLFKTQIQNFYLVADDQFLFGCFFEKQNDIELYQISEKPAQSNKIIQKAIHQLESYLNKKIKKFDLPLYLNGTEFQKKVWKQLLKIPYGKTQSYKDVANQIKSKAIRAVGSANGKNPFCIIVPCHRVIAHNGQLGGYAGGLKLKQALLNLEKI